MANLYPGGWGMSKLYLTTILHNHYSVISYNFCTPTKGSVKLVKGFQVPVKFHFYLYTNKNVMELSAMEKLSTILFDPTCKLAKTKF